MNKMVIVALSVLMCSCVSIDDYAYNETDLSHLKHITCEELRLEYYRVREEEEPPYKMTWRSLSGIFTGGVGIWIDFNEQSKAWKKANQIKLTTIHEFSVERGCYE